MAWWNNIGDFAGDIGSIVTGHNPTNKTPPSAIPAGGPSNIPVVGRATSVGGNLPMTNTSTQPVVPTYDDPSQSGIDWSQVPAEVGNFLKDHWQDLAKLGLTAGATYEGIQNANRSNALTQQALGMAGDDYASRGAFRDAAQSKLLNPKRPDLNFMTNTANPFAKKIPVVGGAAPQSGSTLAMLPNQNGPLPVPPAGTAPGAAMPAGLKPPAGFTVPTGPNRSLIPVVGSRAY